MSSLENQLKRLRIPENSSLERASKFKKRTSFLFNAKEASDIDNETVFALALNGLDELKLVNDHFEQFESLLFSESSKHLERSLQTKEVNEKLDSTIRDYLQFLSPYILLKPAHKTLEWLIRRFQVQLYNVDDLLSCVFPYHQSNVFARVVQLLNIVNTKWSWLTSIQKTGSPLPRSTIVQHCLSNPAFLSFISSLVFNAVESKAKSGQSLSAFHVFSSFYASTVIGVLQSLEKVSEELVSSLLNQIVHCLKSNVNDLQAASYMIVGQLSTKCTLQLSAVESLLKTMCKNVSIKHCESLLMCINCLCSTHNLSKIPKKAFKSLCKLPNMAIQLCELSRNYQMDSFLNIFVSHLIKVVLRSMVVEVEDDESEQQSSLLLDLLRDMDVDQTLKMHFTKNILHEYVEIRRTCGDEKDAVIKLNSGVKNIAKIIQNRWQSQIDKTVHDYLVGVQSDLNSEEEIKQNLQWTQDFVSMVLSSIGSQIVSDSGSTLVLALHHPNAEFRKLALNRVSDILKQPMHSDEDKEFLKESLLVKLSDDNPAVVLTVLKLNEGLINICHGEQLVTSLIKLLEKSQSKWVKVFKKALNILLSDKLLEKNSNSNNRILFHLMPLMFLKKGSVSHAKFIVNNLYEFQCMSEWLLQSLKKKTLRDVWEKCSEDSTFQDLAIANAMLLFTVAENVSALENEAVLKTMKTMLEHVNQTQDETFLIMFLIISINVLNITEDDSQRFDVLSIFFPQLLSWVADVTQAEGRLKLYQELDNEVLEELRDGCGIMPVNLISNYIYVVKRKNVKKIEYVKCRIYLYSLEEVIKCLPVLEKGPEVWWTCVSGNKIEKQYTRILLAIFEVLLNGLRKGQQFVYQDEFQSCLQTMIKVQFSQKLYLLRFLTFLWSNTARCAKDQCHIPASSAMTVVQSLHISQVMIKSLDEKAMVEIISDHSQVIPSLVVCLTSAVMAVRQTALETISLIISHSTVQTTATILGTVLLESSEEIKADQHFITSILQRYFSSVGNLPGRRKSKSRKGPAKIVAIDVLEYIIKHIVNKETPSHVVRVLLTTLKKVVTKIFLLRCLPSMEIIINFYLKNRECSSDQSQILLYLIKKFTPDTVILLKSEPNLLKVFLQLLNLSKPFFNGHIAPQEAVLNQISADCFEAMVDEQIQNEVLGKLIDVSMDTSDPRMSGKLKGVLKLIPISANQIETEMAKLVNEDHGKTRKKKKTKTVVSEDWSSSLGLFWQRVVVIIELLQTKDNIKDAETLLPILFKILSMCLEMSEQTSSDYLSQLLLSTMLKICQTHIDQEHVLTGGVLSEEHFSVEQIIHCIRVSGNPQTHHHALSLLATAAQLFPEKVLHNIMSIFTFMGVNVLRQDDTYSFQVIKITVEAIIPALIQAEKKQGNIQVLVTRILRVFVDAFPHVPEHRRLPIFVHLLTTVGTSSYLHVCLALLLEQTSNKDHIKQERGAKESALIFCDSLCNEFSPEIQMSSLVHLLKYLSSLPEEKPEGYNVKRYSDTSGIVFDVNAHSEKGLHQFKLTGVELILSVLGNDNLREKIVPLSGEKHEKMDHFYLSLLEATLKYVTSMSKSLESLKQETTIKFLRVLLRKVYDIVEKVSNLLPDVAFVGIVSQLIKNSSPIIRKKGMELFNKRMAEGLQSYSDEEMEPMLILLDAVILLTEHNEETDVNKQYAFHMVIILSRLLDDSRSLSLKKVFPVAIAVLSNKDAKPQVSSSALLCLAELCSVLKVHAIPFLSKFLPRVLKIVEKKERSDVLLLSALTVIHKVILSLPNFVSPYLRNIITQLMSPAFVLLDESEQSNWKKQIVDRAVSMREDIAVLIKPRILIPNVSQCYDDIVGSANNDCVCVLFQVLCECVTHMSKDDVKSHHKQLLSLFMSALDYRSQHGQDISEDGLVKTENTIIDAFLCLIMRLSESLFRPMFLKLVDWATRTSSNKQRLLVFYHLADRMAEKLKGLFVLFAGYIIKNIASVLDANNITKTEDLFFADDDVDKEEAVKKSCRLLRYILDCLYKCFLNDNQRFVNKERFDRLLNPLVDQIENEIGVNEVFHERITFHLAPCLAQFAAAAGDESYWKTINHHVCLKTRHSSSQVRLAALKVLQELNHKLGEEYLSLLPEIIPFLAELMEDESFEVEQQCQHVISEMENVLGESLQKYF